MLCGSIIALLESKEYQGKHSWRLLVSRVWALIKEVPCFDMRVRKHGHAQTGYRIVIIHYTRAICWYLRGLDLQKWLQRWVQGMIWHDMIWYHTVAMLWLEACLCLCKVAQLQQWWSRLCHRLCISDHDLHHAIMKKCITVSVPWIWSINFVIYIPTTMPHRR